ncbi:MAG TPA: hypothetical protein VFW28_09225 [Micropepsaceae bacterium]|nr:hypothetical protein [Micropepsaceae bacterium]
MDRTGAVVFLAMFSMTVLLPAGPKAAAEGRAIPDFSGAWAHPSLGFGPPLAGPGPVRNLSRLPSGAGNFDLLVGDSRSPILRPEAAEIVRRRGELSMAGHPFPDPDNMCLQNPVPYIFWNFDIEILQQPDRVTIIYEHDDDYREVRLNGTHPAKVVPSVHGDSIGHYEGDTLVVDTVGVKLGPYRMLDRLGTPYTDALHVVERYHLIGFEAARAAEDRSEQEWPRVGDNVDRSYRGSGLQLEFRVEDPGVFTMPWSATQTYLRASRKAWEERVCAENVAHDYEGQYYSDKDAHLPTARQPDF